MTRRRIRVTLRALITAVAAVGIGAAIVWLVVLPRMRATFTPPPRHRVGSQLRSIRDALRDYKLANGNYPGTLSSVRADLPESDGFDYVDDSGTIHAAPLDPWGREYVYVLDSSASYTIYSQGPKTNTTEDDLVAGPL